MRGRCDVTYLFISAHAIVWPQLTLLGCDVKLLRLRAKQPKLLFPSWTNTTTIMTTTHTVNASTLRFNPSSNIPWRWWLAGFWPLRHYYREKPHWFLLVRSKSFWFLPDSFLILLFSQILWNVRIKDVFHCFQYSRFSLRISSIDFKDSEKTATVHFEKPSAAKTALMVCFICSNHITLRLLIFTTAEWRHFGRRHPLCAFRYWVWRWKPRHTERWRTRPDW